MAGEDQAERTPPATEQTTDQAAQSPQAEPATAAAPGFGERGRMRRRARFLRKARELAYRDLGGLVYDLHRFGQRNDQIVLAKLATLGHIDAELRALEAALHEIKPVTVLHEAGIAACPRCAAIHGNEDRFCPGCGLAFAAGAERPLSTAPVTTPVTEAAPATAGPPATTTEPPGRTPSPATTTGPPGQTPSPATTTSPQPAAPAPAGPATTAPITQTPAPAADARPASEPLTTIERPATPALKATAAPVAARPAVANASGDGNSMAEKNSMGELNPADEKSSAAEQNSKGEVKPDEDDRKSNPEQEPTQILRPPLGGA